MLFFQFVGVSDAFSNADPSLVPIKLPLCDLKLETRPDSKSSMEDVKGTVMSHVYYIKSFYIIHKPVRDSVQVKSELVVMFSIILCHSEVFL